MSGKNPIIRFYCLLIFICILLTGCASTKRPFTDTYKGETEQSLSGTRWTLQDLKSSDNFMLLAEFNADGTVSWYNIPDLFNSSLSKISTWERKGNNVVFNAYDGFYLYEGRIETTVEGRRITGRYKTGYEPPIKSHPSGDFVMIEQ